MTRAIFVYLTSVFLGPIVGCVYNVPEIQLLSAAKEVRVFENADQAGDLKLNSCIELGRITALDGLVNAGALHFDGTIDRTITKLQNEAVLIGGNVAVITDIWESHGSGPDSKGFELKLYAIAFRCPLTD